MADSISEASSFKTCKVLTRDELTRAGLARNELARDELVL